ncbi:target of Nesh-SH3 isoform X1 [Astyanax mexicanus]|uniref:Target of Nesh-SH3 isoform X1 n=1 Tax=Astyanax mexicanus TaxID=7994 RepID=A0A8T2LMX4_ASTMX|nr:target of Nesh-SH3 isoform X1 [Astyanax mexicanus]
MRDFIIFIFITQVLLLNLLCTSAARVRRETLMVRINATGDTIVLKFIRPHEDTKLEGYILGYGKSMFSKQYIQLPENGEAYETEIEAEPKYLIAVKSVKANEVKKPCPEKVNLEKPLHLVIGSVTPTSVLLSWGTLLKTPYTDTQLDDCLEESLFTVRYREEEPNKHWNYQTCPGTSTVIDNLKPDTQYEFGVREDNNGWTHSVIHSTADVGIHELLQPKNLLKTQEPIVKALTTFPPTEPVQYSTAHSSTTPLLKLTEPPTVSSTTLGTGSDEITSSTSTEDPLFLTQTASSIHTPTSQSPSKTTDTFQPQQSTISPPSTTTQQQQRTTQQQQPTTQYTTSTTETQPSTSTTTTQVTTTEPPSSTTESRPSTTETTGQLKSTTDLPQTSTTQPQPITAQQKLNTVQSQPITTEPQSTTTQTQLILTQPKPRTSQPQPSPTQPKTTQSQPSPTQPTTTQPQLILTQAKPRTTQSQSSPTQPRTTQSQNIVTQAKPRATQSQPLPTQHRTTQLQSIVTQPKPRTTQSQPSPTQPKTTQTSPTQPKTTQPQPLPTQPRTTQSQPILTQPKSRKNQPQPSPTQLKTTQPSPTEPKTTQTSPTEPKTTQTSPTQPKTTTQPSPTQPTTTQSLRILTQPKSQYQLSPTQTKSTQTSPTQTKSTQTTTIQSQRSTTHQKPRTTQTPSTSQTKKTQQNHSTSQPLTRTTQQQITTHPNLIKEQVISIRPEHPATSQENPFITKKTSIKLIQQESTVSQYLPLYDNSSTASSTPISDQYNPDTTQTVKEPEEPPQTSTKPQYQPTTSTIYYYSTTQQQYNYITTINTKPQVSSKAPNPTDNHVHAFNSIKTLTPTAKSNVEENSPWAETQADTVNKKLPSSQAAPSQSQDGQPLPNLLAEVTNRNQGNDVGQSVFRNSTTPAPVIRSSTRRVKPNGNPRRRVPPKAVRLNPPFKNTSLDRVNGHSGEKHKGMLLNKPAKEPRRNNGPPANPISGRPKKNRLNQVEKLIEKDKTVPDLKKESLESRPILKPHLAPTTEKPVYIKPTPTITPCFSFNGSCFGSGDNSSVFSSVPVSDVDATGKKRYVAPHVIYKTDKPPEQPCSVTDSLSYFPEEEAMNINVTGPPKNAPSNLTVVTVEGCPSFVILDWEKTDNETTEYEVTSSTKGPKGKEVSLITTNQTHTAVENLKPESNYEFTVTPKNDLGSGPSSEPVKFSTESVDPRVTDIPTGKNAIWSSFPFKAADSYSECIGRMFVKRTWYRKYVGIQLCNSLRYKIYLSDSLKGKFYNIGDQTGNGEDHCQFVDSFLDGRTGGPLSPNRLPPKDGFFRAVRQEPVQFGQIGGNTHINYVAWYECGVPIPGSW